MHTTTAELIADVEQAVLHVGQQPLVGCSEHVTVEFSLSLSCSYLHNNSSLNIKGNNPLGVRYWWHWADYKS